MNSLALILLYLFAAVIGVVLTRLANLPAMLGYLIVGVIIGPNALSLAQSPENLHHLGEFGIVFLMFVIGLEFSLSTLKAMRQHVLGLGSLQVLVTMLLATFGVLLCNFLLPAPWRLDWNDAVALSGALSLSSTAIVIKLIADKGELDSEHGRRIISVLLFQDIAVVPLMIITPALGDTEANLSSVLLVAAIKAVVVILVLFLFGRPIMKWWLTAIVKHKSEELFMLNILLITLGLAWLTEYAGLSLALGAFIAGMLISETEYKYAVESSIKPFHDILLGIFFISIGNMLDWKVAFDHWALVLVFLIVPFFFKALLTTALARLLRAPTGVALRTGLYLAQSGEFGFVLLTLSRHNNVIPENLLNPVLAGMVLSMMLAPFIIMNSEKIVLRLVSGEWLYQSLQLTKIAQTALPIKDHIIILGFGRCGQNLAQMVEGESLPYLALDLDPDRIKQASQAGQPVSYGNASRLTTLQAAGLMHAKCVAITFIDEHTTLKILDLIRQEAPHVSVIVRTRDDRYLDALRNAGAAEIVPEMLEGSLMLASQALAIMGVSMRRVLRIVQKQRSDRYDLLRSYFHGIDDEGDVEDLNQDRLICVTIPTHAVMIGMPWQYVDLEGVTIVSVKRLDGSFIEVESGALICADDSAVLDGAPAHLEGARDKLQE